MIEIFSLIGSICVLESRIASKNEKMTINNEKSERSRIIEKLSIGTYARTCTSCGNDTSPPPARLTSCDTINVCNNASSDTCVTTRANLDDWADEYVKNNQTFIKGLAKGPTHPDWNDPAAQEAMHNANLRSFKKANGIVD